MLRWLLNLAALVSLIVCLSICGIWVRSFYYTDQRTWLTPDAFYEVMSGGGGVVIYRLRPADGEVRWVRPTVTHNFLSAEVIEGRLARRRPWKLLLVPYWLPAGAAAVLPGVWILARAHRERRAARVRHCPVCGEVLTAEAASSCPACGWKTPTELTSASETAPSPVASSAATPAPPPATSLNPRPVAYRRSI